MAYVESAFLNTAHGKLGCVHCHGGNKGAGDKAAAHKGLKKATRESNGLCAPCHKKIADVFPSSLHATFRGAYTVMQARSGDKWPQVKPAVDKACYKCHASCGGCHVAKEGPSAQGLYGGHRFFKRAPVSQGCDGCHGGRIGPEYFGRIEGNKPDVHWEKAKMECYDCHSVAEFHGDGTAYPTRLDRKTRPTCLQCHPDAAPGRSKLQAHNVHKGKVSCYTCHSQSYTNCYGCHAGKGSTSEVEFKIGVDPKAGGKYTTLRHVPTTRRMFDAFVPNGQPNYDAVATWTVASPHNIRRVTKQSESCNNCHGNGEIFLLKDTLDPRYPKANTNMAVDRPPERRKP